MGFIFFVRHGEAETNRDQILSSRYEGYPLTEYGMDEVKDTAKQLSEIDFARAYSSPVLRARQTAEILLSGRDLTATVDERIRERDMGLMEGKPAHGGKWIIPMLRKREYGEGVESFQSVFERISSFISDIPEEGNTIVATHESPISMLACSLLGLEEFNGKGIKVGNASVTVIKAQNKKLEILALGSYSIDSIYLAQILKNKQ